MFGKIFTQVGIDFMRNGGYRPEVIVRGVTTSINETEQSDEERIDILLMHEDLTTSEMQHESKRSSKSV